MSAEALAKLRAIKQNPLPTPPIGTPVQWFEKNQEDMVAAAVVTRIHSPGKLELKISKPRHHSIHKQGVLHRSDPIHEQRANPATIAAGAWDYLPGEVIPVVHYELHLQEIARQEKAILADIQSKEDAESARQRRHAPVFPPEEPAEVPVDKPQPPLTQPFKGRARKD